MAMQTGRPRPILLFLPPLLGALLATGISCGSDAPTESDNGDPNVMRVERFDVAPGESRTFSSNFEIIAEQGISIEGELIITPDEPGDFKLTVEQGTLRIAGTVRVDSTEAAQPEVVELYGGVQPTSQAMTRIGVSLDFSIIQEGGLIDLTEFDQLGAGNAQDEPAAILKSGGGVIIGTPGQQGGSIEIRAPGGEIRLSPSRLRQNEAFFVLGSGGAGQDIVVDRQEFTTTDTFLDITGGQGGDGGSLILEADVITGVPILGELESGEDPLKGGFGGTGGGVFWDNMEESILDSGSGVVDRTLPLTSIRFTGGSGGTSQVLGGHGGFAVYWGGRVMHELGSLPPPVTVTSGNGGDLVYAPVPQWGGGAGWAGWFAAIGNRGWPGSSEPDGDPHGNQGGDVTGTGGSGGDIQNDVLIRDGHAGYGGNSISGYGVFVDELLGRSLADQLGFDSIYFGFLGGDGGNGGDRCGCPGGNGGNSGVVTVRSGDGGDAPTHLGPEVRGGGSGDVDYVGTYAGADGGEGDPPGEGGCPGVVNIVLGEPGAGGTPGEAGRWLVEVPIPECGEDGLECYDEDAECETEEEEFCWLQEGAVFTAHYFRETTCIDEESNVTTITDIWEEDGEYVCGFDPPGDPCRWVVTGTHFKDDGTQEDYESLYNPFAGSSSTLVAITNTDRPFCRGATEMYFPGIEHIETISSEDCVTTIVRRLSGCRARLAGRTNPLDWKCCEQAPGNWQARYLPFDGQCP